MVLVSMAVAATVTKLAGVIAKAAVVAKTVSAAKAAFVTNAAFAAETTVVTTVTTIVAKTAVVLHQGRVLLDGIASVSVLVSGAFMIGNKDGFQMTIRAFGVALIMTYFEYGQFGSFEALKMLLSSMQNMMIWQFGEKLFCIISSLWENDDGDRESMCDDNKTNCKERLKLFLEITVGLFCIGVVYGGSELIFSSNFFAGFLYGLKTGAVWWIGEKLGVYLDMYIKSLNEPDKSLNPLSYLVTSLLLSATIALLDLVNYIVVGESHVCKLVASTFWSMMQTMLGLYGVELFLRLQQLFDEVDVDEPEPEP
jgi:hypothetical protein